MPRLLDKARYIILLLLYTTLGVQSEDEFKFGDTETRYFYHSKILPEKKEVTAYLLHNKTEKIFFVQGEDQRPFFLSVIPCASSVEWTLTHKSASEFSSESSDSPSSSQKPTVLHKYTGREFHSFKYNKGLPGLYTINIRPLESDTYVNLYGSNRFQIKNYPKLPKDNTVKIKKHSRKSFTVEWQSSPEETPFDNIIEYHIAVNRKHSFDTFCSLMSHYKGDQRPPLPSPNFNFSDEIQREREFLKKANPIKAAKKNEITYKVLGVKTKYTFNGARPGRKYFVNVFVYNKQTGKASAFKSLVVRTKSRKRQGVRIKNGKINEHKFTKPKQRLTMEFKVNKPTKEVLLGVHVCGGKIRFQIRNKKKKVFSRRIKSHKEFILKDLEKGTYTVRIKGSKKVGGDVRFTLSTKRNKYRFPRLPKDTRVTTLNSTCENVTIAWLGETQRQKFCVYKTELSEGKLNRRPKHDQCSNEIDKASELVFCKRFKNHNQQLLRETITGLKANSNYTIDVVVKRNGNSKFFLRYDSLHIKTEKTC